jgi:magnesium chelatase family protein
MNPCRCGYDGDAEVACRCGLNEPERYQRKVSGPLLDRLDLRVELRRVPPADLLSSGPAEASRVVAERIAAARARALARNQGLVNAELVGTSLVRAARLGGAARERLSELATATGLSARATHRLLRVARTIADLAGLEAVEEPSILAAAALRSSDGGSLGRLAA